MRHDCPARRILNDQREHMMRNWHRWRQMTPDQRREARRRLGAWRQHPQQQ
jgi:hypothetical protein